MVIIYMHTLKIHLLPQVKSLFISLFGFKFNTESFSPNIESNVSSESLQKYKEKIPALPKDDCWSPLPPIYPYKGFWFSLNILEGAIHAQDHFQAQQSDSFICSPSKTGCTWLKALIYAIVTRNHFDNSTNPLRTIFPHNCIPFLEFSDCSIATATATGSGMRLFASHLPYIILPKSIIDSDCKIVYLWRDPKDTFVSLWHFLRKLVESNHPGKQDMFVSIEEALELFCKGSSYFGRYYEHVLGYWKASLERPDKILFLKYEDMMKDTQDCVKQLADFFGCPFSFEEVKQGMVDRIIKFCSFENLSNLEVSKTGKQVFKDTFIDNSSYIFQEREGRRLEKSFDCRNEWAS